MSNILHTRINDIIGQSKKEHKKYEYNKKDFVPRGTANQCVVSVYEIPPQKSAYPYHYHTQNEEVFYIISGSGILKTPDGERLVSAGDLLFFPANEKGAHMLTNNSSTDTLIYLDFDTRNSIDVAFYPDTGKIGIWGKDINKMYMVDENVDYYDGE